MSKFNVEQLEEFTVVGLVHKGEYEGDGELYDRMLDKILEWAEPKGLFNFPKETQLVSVYNEEGNQKELYFGITIDKKIDCPDNLIKRTVEAGKYVTLKTAVKATEYGKAWGSLYGYIGENGYRVDDKPAYELQFNDSCEHPEKKHEVKLCVPIK